MSWALYLGSWIGFVLCFSAWLLGWISDRAMLGITLALSWLALVFEARTGLKVTKQAELKSGQETRTRRP
jgi:hypothetical protein